MLKSVFFAYALLTIASALPSPTNPDRTDHQLTALGARTHHVYYIRDAIQGRFVEVTHREDPRRLHDLDRRKYPTEDGDNDEAEGDVHIEARTHRQAAAASTTSASSAAASSSGDSATTSSSSEPSSSSSPSTTSSSSPSTSSSSSSTPTSAPTAATTSLPPPPSKQQSSVPTAGIAVGVVLGVTILAGAGILGFIYYRRSRRRQEGATASTNRDSLDPTNDPTVAASGGLVPDEGLRDFSQRNSTATRTIEDMFERRGSSATGGPLSSNPMNYIPLEHMLSQNPADPPEPEEDPPYDLSRTSSVYDPPHGSRSPSSSLYDPPSSGLQADRHSYERSRPGSVMLSPGLQGSPLRNQIVRTSYYETPDDVGRRFSFEAQSRTAVVEGGGSARRGSFGS